MEEKELHARNYFYFVLIFLALWLSYCWWLSERYQFNFGPFTTLLRLLFCMIHVLTVWKCSRYLIRLTSRFVRFSQDLRSILTDHLIITFLSFILFLILSFVLNFKDFLRNAFAIVD